MPLTCVVSKGFYPIPIGSVPGCARSNLAALACVQYSSSDFELHMHIASMDIEFDPDKAASNLRKHKVSFAHAEQALLDSMAETIKDPDAETGFLRLMTALGNRSEFFHPISSLPVSKADGLLRHNGCRCVPRCKAHCARKIAATAMRNRLYWCWGRATVFQLALPVRQQSYFG